VTRKSIQALFLTSFLIITCLWGSSFLFNQKDGISESPIKERVTIESESIVQEPVDSLPKEIPVDAVEPVAEALQADHENITDSISQDEQVEVLLEKPATVPQDPVAWIYGYVTDYEGNTLNGIVISLDFTNNTHSTVCETRTDSTGYYRVGVPCFGNLEIMVKGAGLIGLSEMINVTTMYDDIRTDIVAYPSEYVLKIHVRDEVGPVEGARIEILKKGIVKTLMKTQRDIVTDPDGNAELKFIMLGETGSYNTSGVWLGRDLLHRNSRFQRLQETRKIHLQAVGDEKCSEVIPITFEAYEKSGEITLQINRPSARINCRIVNPAESMSNTAKSRIEESQEFMIMFPDRLQLYVVRMDDLEISEQDFQTIYDLNRVHNISLQEYVVGKPREVQIKGLLPGTYRLVVIPREKSLSYEPARKLAWKDCIVEAGEEKDIVIEIDPIYTITGKVKNEKGRAIEDIWLQLRKNNGHLQIIWTNEAGDFLTRVQQKNEADQYRIHAEHKGYTLEHIIDFSDEKTYKDIELVILSPDSGTSAIIYGAVTNEQGIPIKDCSIYAFASGQDGLSEYYRTDEDGNYHMELQSPPASPVRLFVSVRSPEEERDCLLPEQSELFQLVVGDRIRKDFVLEHGSFVAGRVSGGEGKKVYVNAVKHNVLISRANTDSEGRFHITRIPKGTIDLVVHAKGKVDTLLFDVPTGKDNVMIALSDGGKVRGILLANGQNPYSAQTKYDHYFFALHHKDGINHEIEWHVDDSGLFELEGLDGIYDLWYFNRAKHEWGSAKNVQVHEGADADGIQIDLQKEGQINGMFRTRSNKKLQKYAVEGIWFFPKTINEQMNCRNILAEIFKKESYQEYSMLSSTPWIPWLFSLSHFHESLSNVDDVDSRKDTGETAENAFFLSIPPDSPVFIVYEYKLESEPMKYGWTQVQLAPGEERYIEIDVE